MKKARTGYFFIAPLITGVAIFYAIPFGMVIYYSLVQNTESGPVFTGLSNFRATMDVESFQLAFGNSLRFLGVSLPLIMLLAYLIALLLRGQAEKHRFLKSVFLFPYIMPVVGSVVLVDLLFSETGLLNGLLSLLGLPVADWLSGPHAFWVVVLLYLWKNTGYSAILLLAGLVTISSDQYEAADLDGASSLQKFRYITTPQMWYSVFFALAFSVINAFKCFREIFLIGGVHPNLNIYMLQHFINNCFENINYSRLSVSSVLLLLAVFLFFSVFYIFVKRKEV